MCSKLLITPSLQLSTSISFRLLSLVPFFAVAGGVGSIFNSSQGSGRRGQLVEMIEVPYGNIAIGESCTADESSMTVLG
jgi:hypothetical protein